MQCRKCNRRFFGMTGGSRLCSLCLSAAEEKRIRKPLPLNQNSAPMDADSFGLQ